MGDLGEIEVEREEENGIRDIWQLIDPVWKLSRDDLVDMMCKRVVFQDDELIAFDKPYQMAYASSPKDQAQLDRILQDVKKRVAPEAKRLHLVTSLEKACSGIVLFAKTEEKQRELLGLLEKDRFVLRFRCLVRGVPELPKARISIPLIKVLNNRDFKLCPLSGTAKKREVLYHLNTDYRVVDQNLGAGMSLVDCFVQRALVMPHIVRSHLYYGINCPILGDAKYVKPKEKGVEYEPVRLSDVSNNLLGLRKNWGKRLPMYMHLAEIHVPGSARQRRLQESRMIRAEMPAFFNFTLRRPNAGRCVIHQAPRLQSEECSSLFTSARACQLVSQEALHRISSSNSLCPSVEGLKGIILYVQLLSSTPPEECTIDWHWERRVHHLVQMGLTLEHAMWQLSTLGGALSSMGDFFETFADRALEVSFKQRRLASVFGDPSLVSRCNLFIALALAQKGYLSNSLSAIRSEYHKAKEMGWELIMNCSKGLFVRVKQMRKSSKRDKRENRLKLV